MKLEELLTFQQKVCEQLQQTSKFPLPRTKSTANSQPGAGHHFVYRKKIDDINDILPFTATIL